jgi:predicted transcriptional regulator
VQTVSLQPDTWAEAAAAAGVSLELLAVLTGKSYSAVYRYKTGSRKPPSEWLAQVSAIVNERRITGRDLRVIDGAKAEPA